MNLNSLRTKLEQNGKLFPFAGFLCVRRTSAWAGSFRVCMRVHYPSKDVARGWLHRLTAEDSRLKTDLRLKIQTED